MTHDRTHDGTRTLTCAERCKRWREKRKRLGIPITDKAHRAAYMRKWRRENPEMENANHRRYRRRRPDVFAKMARNRARHKKRANFLVYKAVRSGRLVRSPHCQMCGVITKTQAHHPDYNKPLEVIWTCRPCHLLCHGLQVRVRS